MILDATEIYTTICLSRRLTGKPSLKLYKKIIDLKSTAKILILCESTITQTSDEFCGGKKKGHTNVKFKFPH